MEVLFDSMGTEASLASLASFCRGIFGSDWSRLEKGGEAERKSGQNEQEFTRYDVPLVVVAKRVAWVTSLKKPRFRSSESEGFSRLPSHVMRIRGVLLANDCHDVTGYRC